MMKTILRFPAILSLTLFALLILVSCPTGYTVKTKLSIITIGEEGGEVALNEELQLQISPESFGTTAILELEEVSTEYASAFLTGEMEFVSSLYSVSSSRSITSEGVFIGFLVDGVSESDELYVLHISNGEAGFIPAVYDQTTGTYGIMTDSFSLFGLIRNNGDPVQRSALMLSMNKRYLFEKDDWKEGIFSSYDDARGLFGPWARWGQVVDPQDTSNDVLFCAADRSDGESYTFGYPKEIESALEFHLPPIEDLEKMTLSLLII